jgi:uncharacterized membrane protein
MLAWLAQGLISPGRAHEALRVAGVYPSIDGWSRFVDRLLLGLGLALLLSGVVTFFAANWSEIGRFGRFLLIDALLLAALAAVWRLGLESLAGRAALFAAAVFVGVLLALIGQTYQTGADAYELFAAWAALILPWVILGRFALLWIFWIALVNLAAYLYYDSFHGFWGVLLGARETLWLCFGFNTLALAIWELATTRAGAWLQGRWGPRLLATVAGVPITFLALEALFETYGSSGLLDIAFWLLWMIAGFFVYRLWRLDVYMLAGGLLSLIVVVAAGLTRWLLDGGFDIPALLLIALVVLAMSSLGGRGLIRLANRRSR